jgi:two-component system sensor histidine kinase RegB
VSIYPSADPNHDLPHYDLYVPGSARNVALLVQLRWMAVIGQLVAIWFAARVIHVRLPLIDLLGVPLLLVVINIGTIRYGRSRAGYTHLELLSALVFEVTALGWQLYFSGGTTNPFSFLFLLQIVMGAILLPPNWSWMVATLSSVLVVMLTFYYQPLQLPPHWAGQAMRLYLLGGVVSFALIASLLMFFVIRMDRIRQLSDLALAALRQQAAEEHHIVRMGMLASGAAHELGTPMATMAVLLGDWLKHPAIRADSELASELREMDVELRRCKTIVSGILMSAGQARGENPTITPISAFIRSIGREWTGRSAGGFRVNDRMAEDPVIVSDPALRQVIGNVIDNALEVSPDFVLLTARITDRQLILEVRDHGPGFAPEMIEAFGRPYSSTKGVPGGGLGLFLVVNVVRKLGGGVQVANNEDAGDIHGGAVVQISIPLAALVPAGEDDL